MKTIYTILVGMMLSYQAFSSELFIRVAKSGIYTGNISNQSQTNPQNVFHFYDLAPGNLPFQLIDQQSGNVIFYQTIVLAPNQRVIAEINGMNQITILQSVPITVINWYETQPQMTSPNYGNPPIYGTPTPTYGTMPPMYGTPPSNGYVQPITDQSFPQFLAFLDRQTMDNTKLQEATNYINKTMLSSQQIIEVAKKFTFDSNKLAWAKAAYPRCYDPANYFLFKDVFTFSSSYSDLQKFIGH